MGCGCGGGRTRRGYTASYSSGGQTSETQEWVVTYPSGQTETFSNDTDAYRAVRRNGGGIQQRAKS